MGNLNIGEAHVGDQALRVEVVQAPEADLPTRTSYSQMALFNQCGLRYYFQYLGRWKEPTSAALACGSITHEIIEMVYRLPAPERTRDRALELMREHGMRLLRTPEYQAFENDNAVKAQIMDAVQNLFKVEDPQSVVVQPEHLEMELNVDINGVRFFGKVDRLTVDGTTTVTDYKTGRSPGKYVDDRLAQPYLYALAFREQFDMAIDDVELIYLNAKETVRRPTNTTVMESMGEKLATMRAGAQKCVEASAWDARVQRLCDYCPFERVCPARNFDAPQPGTPASDNQLAAQGLLQR